MICSNLLESGAKECVEECWKCGSASRSRMCLQDRSTGRPANECADDAGIRDSACRHPSIQLNIIGNAVTAPNELLRLSSKLFPVTFPHFFFLFTVDSATELGKNGVCNEVKLEKISFLENTVRLMWRRSWWLVHASCICGTLDGPCEQVERGEGCHRELDYSHRFVAELLLAPGDWG